MHTARVELNLRTNDRNVSRPAFRWDACMRDTIHASVLYNVPKIGRDALRGVWHDLGSICTEDEVCTQSVAWGGARGGFNFSPKQALIGLVPTMSTRRFACACDNLCWRMPWTTGLVK